MSGFNVSVIVYINGVKFHPSSISITASDGSHLGFSVEVPAVPQWDALPERSHAAVFFADPISNSWRFLCEGEYLGYNKVKTATGTRRRSLLFRGLHAMWDTVQRLSIVGGTANGILSQIVANSQVFNGGTVTPTTKMQTDYSAFISTIAPNAQLSLILPALIDAMVKQSPVDTFYHSARKLLSKLFTFNDKQISGLMTVAILQNVLQGTINQDSAGKTLSHLIADLENTDFYHHVPLLCPPLINLGNQGQPPVPGSGFPSAGAYMPEMLFIPFLQDVIPPACNVVFLDQIEQIDMTRNYLAEPTRVIVQVETGIAAGGHEGNVQLPAFVLVNNVNSAVVSTSLLNQSSITFSNDNSSDPTVKVAVQATHNFMTTEEYTRGVIPHFVSFPLQNFFASPTDSGGTINSNTTAWLAYLQSAARTHFQSVRAGARSATVSCAFLPYIAVGFPCLIEDTTGPFWGIVSSVTHTLIAGGKPGTVLQISHIREAFSIANTIRNVPLATWLNNAFYPANVDATYRVLFGPNLSTVSNVVPTLANSSSSGHAAMLPNGVITQSVQNITVNGGGTTASGISEFAAQQVNLDTLASYVMYIPSYTGDLSAMIASPDTTIASNIHSSPDAGRAALSYQYRPGVTLSQYAKFHGLNGVQQVQAGAQNDPDYAFGGAEPDNLVTNSSIASGGDPLFGAPQRMGLSLTPGDDSYGPFELLPATTGAVTTTGAGLISPIRQNAAKMIASAIAVGITGG